MDYREGRMGRQFRGTVDSGQWTVDSGQGPGGGDRDGERCMFAAGTHNLSVGGWEEGPPAVCVEVVDGIVLDDGVGDGVVVDERGAGIHAGLDVVDLAG